jgi:hypothetical protein
VTFKFSKASPEQMKQAIETRRKKGQKWPLSVMKVGDMIEIKQGEYGTSDVKIYPHCYGITHNMKFSTKKISHDTYRVIRIE